MPVTNHNENLVTLIGYRVTTYKPPKKKKKKKLGVHEEATAKRKLRRHLEDTHWKALLLGLLEKKNT